MGIAQTTIDFEGNWIGDKENEASRYVRVSLSTNDPKNEVSISFKIAARFSDTSTIHLDGEMYENDVKPGMIKAGIPVIAQKLRERIERKKKSDSAFRPSEITDEFLVRALNTLSLWEEKQLVWTTTETNKLP
jgi:hypothetical protein